MNSFRFYICPCKVFDLERHVGLLLLINKLLFRVSIVCDPRSHWDWYQDYFSEIQKLIVVALENGRHYLVFLFSSFNLLACWQGIALILTLFVFQIPSTSMKYFDKMCLLPRNLIANYLKHIWKSSLKTLVRARSAAGQVALKILKLSEFELIQTVDTLTVHTVHCTGVQLCWCGVHLLRGICLYLYTE